MFVCAQMLWRGWLKVTNVQTRPASAVRPQGKEWIMNRIIWLVGAVVIVLFVLGYFGLR